MSNIRKLLNTQFKENTTEIIPSMESLLDIASLDTTVSTEGFVDGVATWWGDVKRNWTEGSKPDITTNRRRMDKVKEGIRLYYTNPNWLSRRRFIEGNVKLVREIPFLIVGQHVGTLQDAYKAIEVLDGVSAELLAEAKRWAGDMEPIAARIRNGEVNDITLDEATARLRTVTSIGDAVSRRLERTFLLEMGYRQFSGSSYTVPTKTPVKHVPAMTQQGIIDTCDFILRAMERIESNYSQVKALVSTDTLAFAGNPNWRGWKAINEYRYGKNEVFKHMPAPPTTGNDYIDAALKQGASITKGMLTDEEKAIAWEQLLANFKGVYPYICIATDRMYMDIINAYARWIDASVR